MVDGSLATSATLPRLEAFGDYNFAWQKIWNFVRLMMCWPPGQDREDLRQLSVPVNCVWTQS